jgi:UDP-3-O-[3-hydroxymyristoyl] glucosamine N-acyltransferase
VPAPPTTADAVAFLVGTGDVEAGTVREGPAVRLVGMAPDDAAGPGEAAWVSARRLAADPDRTGRFGGSFLVVPAGADTAAVPETATVVPAKQPRLAFSRLAARFFADPADPGWPPLEGPLPADARIGRGVRLARGVALGRGVEIGDGCVVGPNTALAHCTLGRGVEVGAGCTVGGSTFGYTRDRDGRLVAFPHVGRVVLEDGVYLGDGTTVDRGTLGDTVIGAGTKVDKLVRIAHNVRIGRDCLVIGSAMLCGSVVVEDAVWIAPGVTVMNGVRIGAGATVGLGAVVLRDVAPGATVAGNPARRLR